MATFSRLRLSAEPVERPLANRIVHTRFWHENAWL
jgi:hypothetical protein